jgi:hypothetical protein
MQAGCAILPEKINHSSVLTAFLNNTAYFSETLPLITGL